MISDEVVRRLQAIAGAERDEKEPTPGPGETLADRFEILARAGSGGMGTVYRALDRTTGQPVAVKLLHAAETGDLDERFAREARALAEIDHPAVVRYVAHGRTPSGRQWLAMEWLEGEDLRDRLSRSGLSLAESLALARRVAEGLAAAHRRGVVHRDVKPRNLFLPGGEVPRVKVLDFGIARVGWAVPELTRPGFAVGTWGYMSPEQARGAREIDARADVFSLGCVVFECLTGSPPFAANLTPAVLAKLILEEAPRLSELLPEAPASLDSFVARLLSKDPAARPADGAAVAAELDAMGAVEVLPARPTAGRAVLGGRERRVVSLVLAGVSGDRADPGSTTPDGSVRADPLRSAVEKHGGRLERLADGSIVATFAGAAAATDQAARAARAAIAMRTLLPGRPISLATGRGDLSGRLPVGDAIDRAASLGGSTVAIRIDEITAGLLDVRFEVGGEASGLLLLEEREPGDPVRTLLGKPTPFVSRAQELGTLEAALAASAEERAARVVLVTGAPGTGKSRLQSELASRLAGRGGSPEPWIGRGDPSAAGTPFGPLAQMLRRVAGLRDGEPIELARRKLRARVGRNVASQECTRVAEFLGEMCGVPFSDEASVGLHEARRDAMAMGDQIRRAFEDFVEAEAAAQPVVIFLEDLHWGDRPTVDLVDRLLRNLSDRPILVVAFARPEVYDLFPGLWAERDVVQLRLGRLPVVACEKLVRAVLGDDVPEARVRLLVDRSDGNAFFLEELLRAAAEEKWEGLPGTVVAMVQSRLEALEPEARRVLRAASVFGPRFAARAVAALVDADVEIDGWLSSLAERELVTALGGMDFAFRHDLVRAAAYAMLTEDDRRLGHRLAGEWLSAHGELDPLLLAEHFEAGAAPARAAPLFLRAAQLALDRSDFEGAVLCAERSVRAGIGEEALGEARLVQAQALRWSGKPKAAKERAADAIERLAPDGARYFDALGELGRSAQYLGDTDATRHAGERLLAAAPASGAETALAMALLQVGGSLWSGELDARLIERAERVAGDLGSPRPAVEARLHAIRALGALRAGDFVRMVVELRAALARVEQAGDVRLRCVCSVNEACGLNALGRYEEAERILCDAIVDCDRLGLAAIRHSATESLVVALLGRGAVVDARRIAAEAISKPKALDARAEALARIRLAGALQASGDLDAAEREAARAVDLVTAEAGVVFVLANVCLAQVHLARGRADAARELTDRIEPLVGSVPMMEWESLVRLVCAQARHASGDREGAAAAIALARERVFAIADRIPDPAWRETFLARVGENARTLALAGELLGPPG